MRNTIMRLLSKSVSSLLVFTLILSALPMYAHAEEDDNDPVIVVSLGDSYSSGEGIEPFYGQNKSLFQKVEDKDWLSHRSQKSWPSLLTVPGIEGNMGSYRADYGAVSDKCEWYFGAVSGAETKHFKREQQEKKYVKDTSILASSPTFIWDTIPLPKQLDIFDNIDGVVDYVTLTIGGNDVDFTGIITTCVLQPDYLVSGVTGKSWFLENKFKGLWEDINDYLSDIRQVYIDIAHKAPLAAIIVAGYPQLLAPDGYSKVISSNEASIVNQNVTRFNRELFKIIDELDDIINIYFVDVETEFNKDGGHQAYSSDPWINPVWAGARDEDINDLSISSSYSIHPNEEGAKAYANCVNKTIAEIDLKKRKGDLEGDIRKASDRTTPVTDARIQATAPMGTFNAVPDNSGHYKMTMPINRYYVTVNADGYVPFKAYAVIKENQTEYMQTFLMVEGEETDIGSAQGMITNALNGVGLSDVTLDVRKGWNNEDDGEILTTVTTDDYGAYLVTLPIGNYTLCASKEGFAPTMVNIIVQKTSSGNQDSTMSPILSGDDYRIVLTWGENPRDLDSHVVGTLTNGGSFHVYYNHKSQYDGDVEVCNLDLDDVDGEGPETITLHATTSNPYYYYIYRFAGSGTVASSSAQIKVYQGEHEIATFNVPTNLGDGDYWNVFAIVDGQLVVRNTMTNSAETNYVSTGATTYSLRNNRTEHPVYDDRYPAKDGISPEATEPEATEETVEVSEVTMPTEAEETSESVGVDS